jgi:hypothetical protein
MKLWRNDMSDTYCLGHEGDSQYHTLFLKSTHKSAQEYGKQWIVFKTEGGTVDDLKWEQGDGSIRGVTFLKWRGDFSRQHLIIFFSKGKHHEFADGGWSGQSEKIDEFGTFCSITKVEANGEGEKHTPPFPTRIAIILAPIGAGDKFGYTNVGSRDFPFFDDLTAFGFPNQRVWSGKSFYSESAAPVDRKFK